MTESLLFTIWKSSVFYCQSQFLYHCGLKVFRLHSHQSRTVVRHATATSALLPLNEEPAANFLFSDMWCFTGVDKASH